MPELKLKRGDAARLWGPLSLKVKEGEISVSGGLRGAGERVTVPLAKSLPLEAETDAVIEYKLGADGKVEGLSGRAIPHEWDKLADSVLHEKPRTILVEGDVDTGKTLFSTYLANISHQHGLRVAVVDGDPGQSDIGPPSTVGLGILERPVASLQEVPVRAAYFVGSISPSGHMMELLIGMKRMVERGLGMADMVIVDTAGWISGAGRMLKLYEMELIKPDLVIALQRGMELEHLLKIFTPIEIRRLRVSTEARTRTQADRSLLRELVFAKYLENSSKLVLDLHKVKLERCYMYTGTLLDLKKLGVEGPIVYAEEIPEGLFVVRGGELDPKSVRKLESRFGALKMIRKDDERNALVGLVDDESEMLGIGVVDKIDFARGQMVVLTPFREADRVAAVQFGSMRIMPDGKEAGRIRPGTF